MKVLLRTTAGNPEGGSCFDNEELVAILFRHRDGAVEMPVDTVALELVDQVIERYEGIVDSVRPDTPLLGSLQRIVSCDSPETGVSPGTHPRPGSFRVQS